MLATPPNETEIHSGIPKIFYDLRGVHSPMGLLYIASYLKKKRKEKDKIEIYDISGEGDSLKEAIEKIKEFSPDIFGIQMFTMTAPNVLEILKAIKKTDKKIKTVVGGPHPTVFPEETLDQENVDYIVLGEGEIPFQRLIESFSRKDFYPKIEATGFKKDGKYHLSNELNKVDNPDSVPVVDRGLLNLENYQSSFAAGKKITSLVTSRGCPYNCIFCAKFESQFRAHSAEYVVKDIESALKLGIEEIFVVDDTFSLDLERAKEICRLIIEKKLNFDWYINTRINSVDEELLVLLKKAGCRQINYGIESGSQKIIDALNKNIDLERAKEVIRATKKAGIQTLCYFMIGLPGETMKEIDETRKFIKEAAPDYVRFSVTTLEPSTKLYEMALKKGIVDKDVWTEFAECPSEKFKVPVWEENFTEEELNQLLSDLSKEHYLKPSFLIKNALRVRSPKELFSGFLSFLKILKL